LNLTWSRFPLLFSLPQTLQLTLKNTGNTNSTPRGLVQIFNHHHTELARGAVNTKSQTILPGSQRLIAADLQPTHSVFLPISLARLELRAYDATRQSPFAVTKRFLYIHPGLFSCSVTGAGSPVNCFQNRSANSRRKTRITSIQFDYPFFLSLIRLSAKMAI
jgi:hypothetical protein